MTPAEPESADITLPDTAEADAPVDGRTWRRERNRSAVIESALALYDSGRYPFTMQDVSEHSGVSVRSIYRYFANLDELVQAAAMTRLDSVTHTIDVFEPHGAPLSERIDRFLESRLALLERVQLIRAVNVAASRQTDPDVHRVRAAVTSRMREQFETIFRPELEELSDSQRLHATVAIETLMLPAAVQFRREQLGMPLEDSLALLSDVIRVLLTRSEDVRNI